MNCHDSYFMTHDSIILGIDPGYGRIGIAVLEKNKGKENLLHSECLETSKMTDQSERLLLLKEKIRSIIKEYSPSVLAIESLLWSKNKKTAFKVSEARGVIIVEAKEAGLEVREFNPNQVKVAVTGYGKSDKKQVQAMVERIIKIKPTKDGKKRIDDEYDAIAIALTCSATTIHK